MMLAHESGFLTIRYMGTAGLTYGIRYQITGVTDQGTFVEFNVVYKGTLVNGFTPVDDGSTKYWVDFDIGGGSVTGPTGDGITGPTGSTGTAGGTGLKMASGRRKTPGNVASP